jgi:hypothetical protein
VASEQRLLIRQAAAASASSALQSTDAANLIAAARPRSELGPGPLAAPRRNAQLTSMADRQTRFDALYNEYLGRFKEDPPLASLSVEQAVAAMERALARGAPLTSEDADAARSLPERH